MLGRAGLHGYGCKDDSRFRPLYCLPHAIAAPTDKRRAADSLCQRESFSDPSLPPPIHLHTEDGTTTSCSLDDYNAHTMPKMRKGRRADKRQRSVHDTISWQLFNPGSSQDAVKLGCMGCLHLVREWYGSVHSCTAASGIRDVEAQS
jgi:hypothetical protein